MENGVEGKLTNKNDTMWLAEIQQFALIEIRVTFHL